MEGTKFQRFLRVVTHLATNPTMISRYISQGPMCGKSPVQQELPWISFRAVDFLAKHLNSGMRVFEWGAGGSTLFFARRVREVVSVENDSEWLARVTEQLQKAGVTNVRLMDLPFKVGDAAEFKTSRYLHEVETGQWDVILIDGVLGYESGGSYGTHRIDCFNLAERQVVPGGIIVVDDIWMFPEIREHARAKSFREFVGVGPSRIGVTCTGVFFY